MFTGSILTIVLSLISPVFAEAKEPGGPDREQLQHMLLTSADLQQATKMAWVADRLVTNGPTGPAGTTEPSGCPALDNAILAQNTGLTDSGVQPFHTAAGQLIEETVVYDPLGIDHVHALAKAIDECPAMQFTDGPKVELRPMDLKGNVAGFRAFIGGQARSGVVVANRGDYVVELVTSDEGNPDDFYLALLDSAFDRVENPR